MTVDQWFETHSDVVFAIEHPKTRSGHKTDIEMWSLKSKAKAFRETITYKTISEERTVELLDDMYSEICRKEKCNV